MKSILISIITTLTLSIGYAQWKETNVISLRNPQGLYSDDLGYFYTLDGFELVKYSLNDTILFRYSDMRSGNVSQVDVTNPLKIIVFYQEFSKVQFLDNTLSERGKPIFLIDFGMEQATLVCNSYDNGLWVFDRSNFSITRFDKTLFETNKLENLNKVFGIDITPNILLEKNNILYLNDPNHGIYLFDNFGGFIKKIPIKGIEQLQVQGRELIYKIEDKFYSYHTDSFTERVISLPIPQADFMRIEKNRMALIAHNKLIFYRK